MENTTVAPLSTGADELKQYLRLARRSWGFVVVSTLVAAAVGIFVMRWLPLTYRATGTLLVSGDDITGQDFAPETVTATYRELLLRGPIFEQVAERLGLASEEVKTSVHVQQVAATALIEIIAEADNPQLAKALADAVTNEFVTLANSAQDTYQRTLVVIKPAALPLEAETDLASRLLFVLVALSFVVSSGIILLRHTLWGSFTSVEEVQRQLGLPILTVTPRKRTVGNRLKRAARLKNHEPQMAEAYCVLRANLLMSTRQDSGQTILLTAPHNDFETALVALNLGSILAAAEKRVLLVDANLRQSHLNQVFQVKGPGLSEVLRQMKGNHMPATIPIAQNFSVLPSGNGAADPLLLLQSSLQTHLSTFKQQADIVLISTPGVLDAADAIVMASQVDYVVLVVDIQAERRDAALRALNRLRDVHANVLGAIVVNAQAPMHNYYTNFSNAKATRQVPYIQPATVTNPEATNFTNDHLLNLLDSR